MITICRQLSDLEEVSIIMKDSNFQFVNPYLEEVNFSANPDFHLNTDAGEVEIRNNFEINIEREQDENRAKVELMLSINAEDEKAPFQLRIKIASDFMWEGLGEEAVKSMLNLNAPALLLGYMRPIVANITNSSIFPAYNIPFINFKESPSFEDNQE